MLTHIRLELLQGHGGHVHGHVGLTREGSAAVPCESRPEWGHAHLLSILASHSVDLGHETVACGDRCAPHEAVAFLILVRVPAIPKTCALLVRAASNVWHRATWLLHEWLLHLHRLELVKTHALGRVLWNYHVGRLPLLPLLMLLLLLLMVVMLLLVVVVLMLLLLLLMRMLLLLLLLMMLPLLMLLLLMMMMMLLLLVVVLMLLLLMLLLLLLPLLLLLLLLLMMLLLMLLLLLLLHHDLRRRVEVLRLPGLMAGG